VSGTAIAAGDIVVTVTASTTAATTYTVNSATQITATAPALAAGNTMVLKPSDTTPMSMIYMANLMQEFLPPGVINVVTGDRDTGRALVEDPVPQMVSITGSVRAGIEVATNAAKDLKRVHLELGGNAPVIVFDDADIEKAAAGIAVAGYFNAGQDCTAASRVLVGLGRRPHRTGQGHTHRRAQRRPGLRPAQQRQPTGAGQGTHRKAA
jgi:acyl-CoA reductase-like NAD-dependent aldehyde dehydrogenase